jgi:hypothetical protein
LRVRTHEKPHDQVRFISPRRDGTGERAARIEESLGSRRDATPQMW